MQLRHVLGLLAVAGALRATPVTFSSGPERVALLELFTSEGCSSCPPAERWLSARANESDLWHGFVPICWHVDYWNRLGWPDRFSSRAFTDRQYAYANAWQSGSVYTPCFVRDGGEWRPTATVTAAAGPSGVLTVHYDGKRVLAEFVPGDPKAREATNLEIHAALLGGGIQSKVTAGENRGETLAHEFVALAAADGRLGDAIALSERPVTGVKRYALAVWVTRRGDLNPIQAVGGWLPAPE